MSNKGLRGRLVSLHLKCKLELSTWEESQQQATLLLGTCINVSQRLPALQDRRCYGTLAGLENLQGELLGKQMHSLEVVLTNLQDTLKEFEGVRQRVCKLGLDAAGQIKAQGLTKAARSASLGAQPSLDDCQQGLQDVGRMLGEELALKRAIVSNFTYGGQVEELEAMMEIFVGQPNIDEGGIRDRLQRVLDTQFA